MNEKLYQKNLFGFLLVQIFTRFKQPSFEMKIRREVLTTAFTHLLLFFNFASDKVNLQTLGKFDQNASLLRHLKKSWDQFLLGHNIHYHTIHNKA